MRNLNFHSERSLNNFIMATSQVILLESQAHMNLFYYFKLIIEAVLSVISNQMERCI